MDKTIVKAVFIIPFYDKDIVQLFDTIESVKYYIKEPYSIICINDCVKDKNIELLEKKIISENVINFVPDYKATWPRNGYGPLFCKIYQGMEYALKLYKFDYIIKIDTDALVTGANLFEYIDNYFRTNNNRIGLIGSYRVRADGEKRTRWQWALYLFYLIYFKKLLSKESLIWKAYKTKAQQNGYKLGESVLGGVYVFSYECIRKIIETYPYNSIVDDKLYLTKIGEDVIFSLLTFASDFRIGDFGRPDDPIAIAQNFLPISKEEVTKKNKKLIHSTKKGLNGESEEELRAYFRSFRK